MPTPRTADTLLRTANRDQRQRLQPAYDAATRRLQRTWETRQRGYVGALKALQAVASEPNASRDSVRTSREYADFKGEFAAAGKQYVTTVRSTAIELESDGRKNGATAAYNAIAATEKPRRVDVGDIARYTAEAAFALSMAQFVSGLIDGIDSKWQQADQRGYSPLWVVKEMRTWADSVPVAAAVNVARTAQLFGARRITLGVYKGNGVKQWIWSASLDGKVCAYCVSMHGTVHDIDEQMSTHHSCFVGETVVSGSKALASSARWYDGEVVDIETASGNKFTVTPNHPILTSKGWVVAGLLYEGDNVIRCLDSEGMHRFINPDDYQVPTFIKDVAESLGRSSEMGTIAVPVAPKDFHGDGVGSNIAVVRTDSLLRDVFNTRGRQKLGEEFFSSGRRILDTLSGQSGFATLLNGFNASPSSVMSRLTIADILLLSAFRHAETIRGNLITNGRAREFEQAAYDLSVNTELLSKSVFGLSSGITSGDFFVGESIAALGKLGNLMSADPFPFSDTTPEFALHKSILEASLTDMVQPSGFLAGLTKYISTDRIVKVGFRRFSGHVYNLQTSTGFYVANNIIAHNCRCAEIPVTPSWADLGFEDGTDFKVQRGDEWLRAQPYSVWERILGKAGAAAYRDGAYTLPDVAGTYTDDVFGVMGRKKSLEEILGKQIADAYKRRIA